MLSGHVYERAYSEGDGRLQTGDQNAESSKGFIQGCNKYGTVSASDKSIHLAGNMHSDKAIELFWCESK